MTKNIHVLKNTKIMIKLKKYSKDTNPKRKALRILREFWIYIYIP